MYFPRFNKANNDVGLIEIIPYNLDILILEGWLIGSKEIPLNYIYPFIDFLIYLNCPVKIAKIRRFKREEELQKINKGFTTEELEEFWNTVLLPIFLKNKTEIIKNSHYYIDHTMVQFEI
ncbi:MAG: hypothetical protein KatS3mg129_2931 [Leptospiraceae bacterium]|nr:MAG: hypothetical protein KatS3mg129_2931 [Leptospiraceae bacterium]